MKITETGFYRPTANQIRKKASASGTSFADVFSAVDGAADGAGSASAAEENASLASVSGVNSLLALQEVDEDASRRRKALQRATNQLNVLERLRQALLTGAIPEHVLVQLKQSLSAQRDTFDDPQLRELLDEVELRVAVELAKLEVARGDFA